MDAKSIQFAQSCNFCTKLQTHSIAMNILFCSYGKNESAFFLCFCSSKVVVLQNCVEIVRMHSNCVVYVDCLLVWSDTPLRIYQRIRIDGLTFFCTTKQLLYIPLMGNNRARPHIMSMPTMPCACINSI